MNKAANTYATLKENARNKAMEYQENFNEYLHSWLDIAYYTNYFEKLGRRYGLLTEFRENGIC